MVPEVVALMRFARAATAQASAGKNGGVNLGEEKKVKSKIENRKERQG
jgi:hypothetical protein